MKYELLNEYKKELLLSEFDLLDNKFDESWFNNFFINPVIKDLIVINNDSLIPKDYYISFKTIELDESSFKNTEEMYKEFHKLISEHINKDWGNKISGTPIYSRVPLIMNKANRKKYLYLFFSPNKSVELFDFSIIDKEKLISPILDILLKAEILIKLNEKNPIKVDLCFGRILLNPISDKEQEIISVFSYYLKFNQNNYRLGFGLKHECFQLEEDESPIRLYNNICTQFKKTKYGAKVDARNFGRLFLDFGDAFKFVRTKFYTQYDLYQNIIGMFSRYNINYFPTSFTPTYSFDDFLNSNVDSLCKNKIERINIFYYKEEIEFYEQKLKEKGFDNGFQSLQDYLKNTYEISIRLFENPTIEEFIKNREEANLFLMFGEKYYFDNYVSTKNSNEKFNNYLVPFFKNKLNSLNKEDFLEAIKNFDIYSAVKMYTLYSNLNGGAPIISQGWILDDHRNENIFNPIFENIPTKKEPNRLIQVLPKKGTKYTVEKIINELNIKFNIYNKNKFLLRNNEDIFNIEIIKKEINKRTKTKIYSYIQMKKNGLYFEIINKKVSTDINDMYQFFNFNLDFLDNSDELVVINNKFIVVIENNDLLPTIILEKGNVKDINKDPILVANQLINGKDEKDRGGCKDSISKKSNFTDNMFFPYNTPVYKKMLKDKRKTNQTYANCLMEFKEKELILFIYSSDNQLNSTVSKNNRLEKIKLYSIVDDFEIEEQNWLENENILNFYLSTLTFDYLSIKEVSKKSVLNKFTDVLINN